MSSRRALLAFLVALAACSSRREAPSPLASAPLPLDRVATSALRARIAAHAPRTSAGPIHVALAPSIAAPTIVSREGAPGASLAIAPLDVAELSANALDGHTLVAALDGGSIVQLADDDRFEEIRELARPLDRIALRYAIELGPALVGLRVAGDRIEALDARGVARLRTEPAFAVDAHDVVRALVPRVAREGGRWIATFSADARDLAPPIAIDPAWTSTASLATPRSGASALPIAGGKVLVVGGSNTATCELYDVATASFTAGPALSRIRQNVNAVKLDDGRVFLGAGDSSESPTRGEVYDPTTNAWKLTVASPYGYATPVATALPNARVLIVGFAGATVYDAKGDTWTATANPLQTRNAFQSVALADGRALLVAGNAPNGTPYSTAELYDPTSGTFASAGAMAGLRHAFAIAQLTSGKVVVAGGDDTGESGVLLDSVELFDPATKTWSAGPHLITARGWHAGTALADGRMLVAGGNGDAVLLTSAEILDAAATTWTAAGSMPHARSTFPLVPVAAGDPRVLAVGGYDGAWLRTVDLFTPLAAGAACKDPGECANGACVDGYCCEKPACAADETCGGASAPGHCRKANGVACANAGECGSGLCVDGVCCDRACDGTCEACDVAPTKGRCTTLSPGEAPHGATKKCPGTGVCAGLCGGVDAKTCTVFPGAATSCGEASCSAGVASAAAYCDGAGGCAAPATDACEPYACGATSCKKACAVDGDCAGGYSCDARSGRCVFGAKCDGAHTVIVPGGASIDCTPFNCGGASCLAKCASSDDCVAGTTCDTASGACVVANGGGGSSGGCATAPPDDAGGRPMFGLLTAALAIAARARKGGSR